MRSGCRRSRLAPIRACPEANRLRIVILSCALNAVTADLGKSYAESPLETGRYLPPGVVQFVSCHSTRLYAIQVESVDSRNQ